MHQSIDIHKIIKTPSFHFASPRKIAGYLHFNSMYADIHPFIIVWGPALSLEIIKLIFMYCFLISNAQIVSTSKVMWRGKGVKGVRVHITEHSPSFCFPTLLLEMRSRDLRLAFPPPFLRSSRRSRALGKFCAVTCQYKFPNSITSSKSEKGEKERKNIPAALQYHLLASSKLAGLPIPTSVKYPIAYSAFASPAIAAFLAQR